MQLEIASELFAGTARAFNAAFFIAAPRAGSAQTRRDSSNRVPCDAEGRGATKVWRFVESTNFHESTDTCWLPIRFFRLGGLSRIVHRDKSGGKSLGGRVITFLRDGRLMRTEGEERQRSLYFIDERSRVYKEGQDL